MRVAAAAWCGGGCMESWCLAPTAYKMSTSCHDNYAPACLHVALPPLPPLSWPPVTHVYTDTPIQATEAEREATEAAMEADAAAAVDGHNADLIDAAKDVAGQLQDKAAGVYDKAKAAVKGAKPEL